MLNVETEDADTPELAGSSDEEAPLVVAEVVKPEAVESVLNVAVEDGIAAELAGSSDEEAPLVVAEVV